MPQLTSACEINPFLLFCPFSFLFFFVCLGRQNRTTHIWHSLPIPLPFSFCRAALRGGRQFHASARADARILASDPIDPVCATLLVSDLSEEKKPLLNISPFFSFFRFLHAFHPCFFHVCALIDFRPFLQRERGHELVEATKKSMSAEELLKVIPEYDGLIVRRCVLRRVRVLFFLSSRKSENIVLATQVRYSMNGIITSQYRCNVDIVVHACMLAFHFLCTKYQVRSSFREYLFPTFWLAKNNSPRLP